MTKIDEDAFAYALNVSGLYKTLNTKQDIDIIRKLFFSYESARSATPAVDEKTLMGELQPERAKVSPAYRQYFDIGILTAYRFLHPYFAKEAQRQRADRKLWLWKNFVDGKQEYWAFEDLYPADHNGDPLTLGEPCGYALVKKSSKPEPAVGDDVLPYDITIPPVTFRKGVKLQTFIDAAKRWKKIADEAAMTPKQQDGGLVEKLQDLKYPNGGDAVGAARMKAIEDCIRVVQQHTAEQSVMGEGDN